MSGNALPELNPAEIPVGIVGVGLMGTSIASCLLASGHRVKGYEKDLQHRLLAPVEVRRQLQELLDEEFLVGDLQELMSRFHLVEDPGGLGDSHLVVECVTEDLASKKETLRRVEQEIEPTAIIGSNTSAIPPTILQRGLTHPERVLGIHWSEPAHVTRFMEIIKGEETREKHVVTVTALARLWGKEPTVLKQDIRGFITNRVSYAMFREALHLVESGVASVEDVDRSLRNDVGYWITFAGPLRYMDLMGVEAYEKVMSELLPELCSSPEVPRLIREVVDSGGRGISNGRGFYEYTPEESLLWKHRFHEFNFEIHRLAMNYPETLPEKESSDREGDKSSGSGSEPDPGRAQANR